MDVKRWAYATLGIAVAAVVALSALWLALQSETTGWRVTVRVNLHDAVKIGNDVWGVEVGDVTVNNKTGHEGLTEFRIALKTNESDLLVAGQLRNGLVAHADAIFVFFEDNGKTGTLDKSDLFYLVGLETGSEFDFRILLNRADNIVGHVFIST
ncbi:MAG: hypothetical protein V3U09_03765 [Thermoplasmata archaeon]